MQEPPSNERKMEVLGNLSRIRKHIEVILDPLLKAKGTLDGEDCRNLMRSKFGHKLANNISTDGFK